MEQLKNYLSTALTNIKLFFSVVVTAINYIMFPKKAYATAALALGGAMLMDIFSKYVAISANNGGLSNAFKSKKLNSKKLWEGTKIKIITYLSITIMVGLSYRLNSFPTSFTFVSEFMATVVYTVLFLRDFQSMLENFRDAGANVDWLLIWSKKQEEKILRGDNKSDK